MRIQAELGARLPFREGARVMSVLLPTDNAANHTSIGGLASIDDRLQIVNNARRDWMSRVETGPMVVALDGARIRAIPGFQVRPCEVTVGRVDTEQPRASHFTVAPNGTASKSGDICDALRSRGWLPGQEVTLLSDDYLALVGSVRSALGSRVKHMLD